MSDLISIIMPAYNAEKYIEQSLQSVLKQSYSNWELLVVNDGSTDQTPEIVKKYMGDGRIRIIHQPNRRLGAARNTGFQHSTGQWIAFLDADDLWEENKLERQLYFAGQNPQADLLFSRGEIFNGDDQTASTPYPALSGLFSGDEIYKLEYDNNWIPVLSVMVKKLVVDRTGLQEQDPYFYGCEDWDYWVRMAKGGASFYGIDESLFQYRRHEANMSSDDLMMRVGRASLFLKNYDPKRFDAAEKARIFDPVRGQLVIELVRHNKIKEAQYLQKGLFQLFKGKQLALNIRLLQLFGRNALFPLRLVNKFARLMKHRKYN